MASNVPKIKEASNNNIFCELTIEAVIRGCSQIRAIKPYQISFQDLQGTIFYVEGIHPFGSLVSLKMVLLAVIIFY